MGWQDDQIVGDVTAPAAPVSSAPWEKDTVLADNNGRVVGNPLAQPNASSGIGAAIEAGYQSSIYGLASRGKLPDVLLDPQHATWYERAAQGATQMALDFPAMVAGGVVGGVAGSEVPVVGNVVGAGAGAFAVPAAIREAYIQAYKNGEIQNSADFLNRAGIVLKTAAKEGIVGAVTGGLGKTFGALAGNAGLGAKAAVAAGTAGEYAGVVVTPSVLEGKMPELNDFVDAAVMLGGLKGVHYTAGKMADIYRRTGSTPSDVASAARVDPQISDELGVPPRITPEIQGWKETAAKPFDAGTVTNSTELVGALKTHLGGNHFAATLVDKLAPTMKGFSVEVIPDSEWKFRGYSQNQQARTDLKNNTIQFRDNIKPEAALHEVIHEATARELQGNAEFSQSIRGIMENVRSAIQNGDVTGVPKPDIRRVKSALKNEAEFVAYGLSSPEVINALRGIKSDTSSPTMFTKFAQTVAQNYGFGAKDYTALHDLIRAVDTGLEPKVVGNVEYLNTRGGADRFHGTGSPIKELSDQTALQAGHDKNIYGDGFYTTDAVDIAVGYTKKGGKEPSLYKVEEKPVKLFDMEAPLDEKTRSMIENILGEYYPFKNYAEETHYNNLREILDAFRDESAGNNLPRYEVQEYFHNIKTELEKEGYRGYEHVGGLKTGKDAHKVRIFWRPENDVKITTINPDAFVNKQQEANGGLPKAFEHIAVSDAVNNATRPHSDAKPPSAAFEDLKEIPGTKPSVDIDLAKISSAEEFDEAVRRHVEDLQRQIDYQKGGRVSWEETDQQVVDMLSNLGADAVLKARDPYDPANRLELRALAVFAQKAVADVKNIAEEMKKAGTFSQEEVAQLLAAQTKVGMVAPKKEGMASEAGRTLNILRNTKYDTQKAKLIAEYMEKFKGDPEAMVDAILALEDPAKVAELSRKIVEPTTWQKVTEWYRASLISGPTSMIANVLGSPIHGFVVPMVDALSIPIGMATGNKERVAAAEPLARLIGNAMGARDGLRAAGIALKTGAKPGAKTEGKAGAIGGLKGEIIRAPFRVLAAGDAFFNASFAHGEHYALAARQATKEGFSPLTREFRDKVAELVSNPSEAMLAAGEEAAKRYTYSNNLGSFGQAVQNAVRAGKLEWVMPFTQTPGNIAKEVLRLTPAGPLVDTWRADFAKGGAARDKAVAELLVGAGIGATVFSYAKSGMITGGGDPDPKKRQTQLASGWQPYSIKIGNTYHSYARMAPIGTVIGLYADLQEAWEHFSPEERDKSVKVASMAIRNAITNQTFLAGLSNLIGALEEPENKSGRLFQNLAGSIVPSAVSQVNQLIDPYQREVNSMIDAVKARVPGLSQSLQPKRNIVGEAVKQPSKEFPFAPITTATPTSDKVVSELARLEISTNKAPKDITLPAMGDRKIGKVGLTPEQRDSYAVTAGEMLHKILQPIVSSPGWDRMPDWTQKKMIEEKILPKVNEFARNKAIPMEQRQAEMTRIQEALMKQLRQSK